MKKEVFFIIICLILDCFLGGCRGQRQVNTATSQQHTSEIGVEFHDLQRFWNSLAERLAYKIEFYPDIVAPTPTTQTNPAMGLAIDPNAEPVPPSPRSSGVGFGIGPVKSFEFSCERFAADSSVAQTDSIADFKSNEASDAQTEKASELRQDTGTWAIISCVAAVVFIVFVLIMIRKFFKK